MVRGWHPANLAHRPQRGAQGLGVEGVTLCHDGSQNSRVLVVVEKGGVRPCEAPQSQGELLRVEGLDHLHRAGRQRRQVLHTHIAAQPPKRPQRVRQVLGLHLIPRPRQELPDDPLHHVAARLVAKPRERPKHVRHPLGHRLAQLANVTAQKELQRGVRDDVTTALFCHGAERPQSVREVLAVALARHAQQPPQYPLQGFLVRESAELTASPDHVANRLSVCAIHEEDEPVDQRRGEVAVVNAKPEGGHGVQDRRHVLGVHAGKPAPHERNENALPSGADPAVVAGVPPLRQPPQPDGRKAHQRDAHVPLVSKQDPPDLVRGLGLLYLRPQHPRHVRADGLPRPRLPSIPAPASSPDPSWASALSALVPLSTQALVDLRRLLHQRLDPHVGGHTPMVAIDSPASRFPPRLPPPRRRWTSWCLLRPFRALVVPAPIA